MDTNSREYVQSNEYYLRATTVHLAPHGAPACTHCGAKLIRRSWVGRFPLGPTGAPVKRGPLPVEMAERYYWVDDEAVWRVHADRCSIPVSQRKMPD